MPVTPNPASPKKLIVSHIHHPRVAILQEGKLCRLLSCDSSAGAGDIYLAKVVRLLPALSVAFLDIGEPKNAVLTLTKDSQFHQGQFVTVMITRPVLANKGSIATTAISLSSPYVVYKPHGAGVGISNKIPKATAHTIRRIASDIISDVSLQGGIVIRTSTQVLDEHELVSILTTHITHLYDIWQDIQRPRHAKQRIPARLYRPPLPLSVLSNDVDSTQIDEILIDDKEMYEQWRDVAGRLLPHLLDKLKYCSPSLFDKYHVYTQLNRALSPQVPLPSGVYLVIEECEAMTVIDVNTGSLVSSSQNLIYQANLEASQAIAFELMLRQIGGLVVIDFIDMKNQAHQQSVYAHLQTHLAKDHAKIRVLPFNEFGLVQLSRERTLLSLSDKYHQPCSACQGGGNTKQGVSVLAIVAKLTTFAHQNLSPKDEIVLRASDGLAKSLLNSTEFVNIQRALQAQFSLKIINTYPDDKYDILLNKAK